MSLGMSGSKSSNSSDAQSTSEGFNVAESGDTSNSLSQSLSSGQSTTTQGIAFEDLYKQLFTGATAAAGRTAMQAPQLAQTAQQLFSGGSQFLQSLGGNAGTNYQEGRLTGENPALEDAITALRGDSESLFRDEMNPAITASAVSGGTLGGGRQGVAQGIAQGKIGQDFLSKAAALRYADVQSKDAMAGSIAGQSIAAASTGLGALPGLLDIMERGQNTELGTYSNLASILGGPTVLSQQQATDSSMSTAQQIAQAFSRSFGQQESQSTATSRGKTKSFGFNFGLPES
jgi:hypothetical protein